MTIRIALAQRTTSLVLRSRSPRLAAQAIQRIALRWGVSPLSLDWSVAR